jgi:hypothetical protein
MEAPALRSARFVGDSRRGAFETFGTLLESASGAAEVVGLTEFAAQGDTRVAVKSVLASVAEQESREVARGLRLRVRFLGCM